MARMSSFIHSTQFLPLKISSNARIVLKNRYLQKNETPEDLYKRVATYIAKGDLKYKRKIKKYTPHELIRVFYNLMGQGIFLPNSPTLMNAGTKNAMLSACFVLPVEDNLQKIFRTLEHTALIQKSGGGTGFNFSKIRAKGSPVSSGRGIAPGPLVFLELFSQGTHAIQQGSFRRGANMGILNIDHPQILEFIFSKKDLLKLNNFNISVAVTDAFIKKLKNNPQSPHIVVNPWDGKKQILRNSKHQKVSVGKLFDLIANQAWLTGEPGLVFMDVINKDNPTPQIGIFEATNPCGEQPLLAYEACTLGSINVSKFVHKGKFCWDDFKEVIAYSVLFLDNVVEMNHYPVPEIQKICTGNRKIGLGLMGLADLFFQLGISYESDEALKFSAMLAEFLQKESHAASEQLAQCRGVFPNWKQSIWKKKRPMRNATVTTIAPTGTISILAGCSSSIEPLFSLMYYRNVLNKQMIEVNTHFEKMLHKRDINKVLNFGLLHGSIQKYPGLPKKIKRVFLCAHDISPSFHVDIQAVFQKYCDSSISKTINFSNQSKVSDIKEIFLRAYEKKCKGITVYRNSARAKQPMALSNKT